MEIGVLAGDWVGTIENVELIGSWGKLAGADLQRLEAQNGEIVVSYVVPADLESGSWTHRPMFVPGIRFDCTEIKCKPVDADGYQTLPLYLKSDGSELFLEWMPTTSSSPTPTPEPCPDWPTLKDGPTFLEPTTGGYRMTFEVLNSTGAGCGYGVAIRYDVVLTRP